MAPEQAEGRRESVTIAADIHGLGAILYELLTGLAPFRGESVVEVLRKVREQEPEPPGRIHPRVPRDLATIALKCLEKDPKRRYATAEAMADDLDRWLSGKPIEARRASSAERVAKWARRRPTAAALLGVCVLLAATIDVAIVLRQKAEKTAAALKIEARGRQNAEGELGRQAIARKQAEIDGYFDRIAAAERALASNDVPGLDRLLEACPPDLREWEWSYLKRQAHAEKLTLRGHNAVNCGVAFVPDTLRFTCPDDGGGLGIWDAKTNRRACDLRGHDGTAFGVAFSRGGTLLATAGADGAVRIWDLPAGTLRATLPGHGEWASAVAFGASSSTIASGGADGLVRVWDTSSGDQILTLPGHSGPVFGVAFRPDGQEIASAGADGRVILWDARTGRERRRLPAHAEAARCVAFSPDGRTLASGGADRTIRVWDARSGAEILSFRAASARIDGLAFSPDGRRIASGALDRSVKVWDARTGRELASFAGHSAPVFSVAFSPDGRLLASAGQDATVKLWDLDDGPGSRIWRADLPACPIVGLAFFPDGRSVAIATDRGIAIRPFPDGVSQEITDLPAPFPPAIDPSGRLMVSASLDGSVAVREWPSRKIVGTFKTPDEPLGRAIFAPDGLRLITGGGEPREIVQGLQGKGVPPSSAERAVRVWDLGSGLEMSALRGHVGPIHDLAVTRDGQLVASAGADGTVRLWRLDSGHASRVLKGHQGAVSAVAFDPEAKRVASAGQDGTIRVWSRETGRELRSFSPRTGWIFALAWTPDGSRIASAGADGSVRIWDPERGRETLELKGHAGRVLGLSFRPGGNVLASGGTDGEVRLWDATP